MGLEKRGAKCMGFAEIKPASIDIYKSHYPDHINYGDITLLKPEELPDFDVLTGGFPCQSFSTIGLRKGINDPRGIMILYIRNLLIAKKPKWCVLENVKGLLTHDFGRTYVKIHQLLKSAGYFVRVVLLNSSHYGSPQVRERIFFLCQRDKEFEKKKPQTKDIQRFFKDVKDCEEKDGIIPKNPHNTRRIFSNSKDPRLKFEHIGDYDRVGTLTTGIGCGRKAVPCEDWFRFLSPLECERLQGFPDGWTKAVAKGGRYFALGNAVHCAVSTYLFTEYLEGVWF